MGIPADVHQELVKILDYVETDEAKDWEAREPKDRRAHIYESVLAVKKWLEAGAKD